jgi:pantetheine-phosphate adenylyltransferase
MKKAFYPGTFDPFTYGHLDIVERALGCFGEVVVGVSHGEGKSPLFTHKERVALTKKALEEFPEIEVISFHGLTVYAAKEAGCNVIIRGLRVVSDYEYEMQLALMNKSLANELETVFLISSHQYIFVSSSVIKEIASHKGDISSFVCKEVEKALKEKFV